MNYTAPSDYSATYRDLAVKAIQEAQSLGFDPSPSNDFALPVSDAQLSGLSDFVRRVLQPRTSLVFPGYRGAICHSLGLFMLDQLEGAGFSADLVIGEVNINGTLEFDTTLEGLKREWNQGALGTDSQALHVWVSIGDDIVIDGGIGSRLARYYGAPHHITQEVFVGRASDLARSMRSQYIPMLVGRAFVRKTNSPAGV